ncbi:hypothetical protein N0V93_007190 [Gnomoniopsis smithogilvyi]|uniref:Major facilitator superfamily (MFS) profile domain-containing protein n=1 Tax=Gnomoniopsis smithogilvyi TaxID=1191159 RepID=A0A9W9CV58_9PEZI|nr:hypothetical protein N0V93_007190 [Gnomoniopsis smithogilvyi]
MDDQKPRNVPSAAHKHLSRDRFDFNSNPESVSHYRQSTISKWRFAFICVGVSLGLFLAMIDSSIVATSLFTIGNEFQDLDRINWVVLAYTLAFVGCSVFFARMADVIGRRNAFLAAYALFLSFSLGCGFSKNMTTLLVGRTFQGIGGSGLFSVTMIIFPEVAPEGLRNMIGPIIGAVISMAGVLGPVLGGALTSAHSWRWIFWINGPIGLLCMIIFYLSWPEDKYLPNLPRRCWRDLDYIGSFLVVAAAVLVTFAFQNAGIDRESATPWSTGAFIGPVAAGILCWIVLVIWEGIFERRWSTKMAAIPLALYRNRIITATTLNTMFLGFSFLATLFAVPLRMQVVNGKSPIMTGVLMLPMLGATGLGNIITGAISRRENRLSETMTVATIMVTVGLALETTVSDSPQVEPKFVGFLAIIGLGYGMITSAATMFTTMEAPVHEHAPAQGVIAQARMLGGSIGISMSSALLALQQRAQLTGIVTTADLQDLANIPDILSDFQQAAIRKTYNDAFIKTMMVCAIVAGVGVILTMGTFRRGRVSLSEQRERMIRDEMSRRQTEHGLSWKEPYSSKSSGRSA